MKKSGMEASQRPVAGIRLALLRTVFMLPGSGMSQTGSAQSGKSLGFGAEPPFAM